MRNSTLDSDALDRRIAELPKRIRVGPRIERHRELVRSLTKVSRNGLGDHILYLAQLGALYLSGQIQPAAAAATGRELKDSIATARRADTAGSTTLRSQVLRHSEEEPGSGAQSPFRRVRGIGSALSSLDPLELSPGARGDTDSRSETPPGGGGGGE